MEKQLLNIAYISYEYPLKIRGGGIGTYIFQISKAMASLGHKITIFCCGNEEEIIQQDGINIYLIKNSDAFSFKKEVEIIFSTIHQNKKFDIIECAEYGADALYIKQKFPDLPLVVKLHAPTYLLKIFNNYFFNYQITPDFKNNNFLEYFKKTYWLFRKNNLKKNIFKYNKELDEEYKIVILADYLTSPSKKLACIIKNDWKIKSKINIIPNIYEPSEQYLIQKEPNQFKTFIFIGKLMILKGVLDLCKAIPLILKKHPDTKFIFVGTALNSPLNEVSMDNYMRSELKNNLQNIVFTGMVSLDKIPILLKQADALIIPSLWENFATVCLEAMSAGKLVIGTKTGGIPEIIGKDCGLLAKYKNYKNLAKKINYAIENPQKMQILAKNGRNKIINSYSQQKISLKMEEIYLSNLNS